jgi:hypothetical protein
VPATTTLKKVIIINAKFKKAFQLTGPMKATNKTNYILSLTFWVGTYSLALCMYICEAKRQTSGKLKIPFALPFGILNSHHLFMQNWSSLPSRERKRAREME